MQQYIWGFSGGWWHALAKHDPAYDEKEVVSRRLTQQRIAKAMRQDPEKTQALLAADPKALDVTSRQATGSGPGRGLTLCGLHDLRLEATKESAEGIGVDPDLETDHLCPACKLLSGLEAGA